MNETLFLITAFVLKHFLCDFPLQTRAMIAHKGTYGHPTGIAHSALHAVFTFGIVAMAGIGVVLGLAVALAEFLVHYHIDWAKTRLSLRQNLEFDEPAYWLAFGLDQMLHYLTYVVMVAAIVG